MLTREKKINKLFLDIVLGSNYMGDRAQYLADLIKSYIIKIFDHLKLQLKVFKNWWEKDD